MSRVPGMVWFVGLAVGLLAVLAVWDESRESAAALDDFAEHESLVARVIGNAIHAELAQVQRDALDFASGTGASASTIESKYTSIRVRDLSEVPKAAAANGIILTVDAPNNRSVDVELPVAALLSSAGATVESSVSRLLVLPPGANAFRTSDGGTLSAPFLADAFAHGQSSHRLDRDEAASIGLPPRTAFAGIVGVDGGRLGRFGVALAASAERERDRERRAGYRVVVGVLLTGGLVASFGGVALRRQKKQLELARALAIAEVERKSDERLEAASRAATLGTMALGIAHELSTPLSVIAGRAQQILGRVTSDERSTTSARAIVDQTERIGEVVRGFLALARGQAPAIDRLAPSDIVDAAVGLVEHRFAKAQVALVPDVGEDLPAIHGDARLLEQALVNLLLNACDACKPGGRVEIDVHEKGASVSFAVEDNGAGISPEHLAHVMEPFFTTKAHGEGTGLGLAVALEIAKSHRGTILLTQRQPRGTRAELCVPVAAHAEAEVA